MATMRATTVPNTTVSKITFNPHDATQVAATGDGIFKLYRYAEGFLKQFGFQKLETRVSKIVIDLCEYHFTNFVFYRIIDEC